ncbi:hypothetical protein V2G26_000370 [Clonostachys chloroleuca]
MLGEEFGDDVGPVWATIRVDPHETLSLGRWNRWFLYQPYLLPNYRHYIPTRVRTNCLAMPSSSYDSRQAEAQPTKRVWDGCRSQIPMCGGDGSTILAPNILSSHAEKLYPERQQAD